MDINDILSVAHELGGEGFSDMAEKEIKELIDGHEEGAERGRRGTVSEK
jgi:hypothetical protein